MTNSANELKDNLRDRFDKKIRKMRKSFQINLKKNL